MIKCRECGAPIEELAERCPYCGAINELGAEHKYMQDMYDLKDDLKEVGNIPSEEIKAEVKSNVHFTGKAVAVLLALVLILAAVFLFLRYSGDIIYSVYNDRYSYGRYPGTDAVGKGEFPQAGCLV